MEELVSQDTVARWVEHEEDEFQLKDFRFKHTLSADDTNLDVAIGRLCSKHKIKRIGRGWYRKIKQVTPLKVKESTSGDYFEMLFPRSHLDDTTFGFEDFIQVSQGDQIIIAGRSNAGKTLIAHNILAENNYLHDCTLMGNEYRGNDGFLLPKYHRRFKRLAEWSNVLTPEGDLNFECLPVKNNYEDYVQKDKINIVDWIQLDKDWFRMGRILDDIKCASGKGITVVVLQKKEGLDYGQGGEQTEHVADVYMTIDPLGKDEARLTLGKVKETKRKALTRGRMWGFSTDDGSNLNNIREIDTCPKCRGKAQSKWVQCDNCHHKGFVDIGC